MPGHEFSATVIAFADDYARFHNSVTGLACGGKAEQDFGAGECSKFGVIHQLARPDPNCLH